jgi:ribosomal protein S18 acetylase RimI-like enzyme
MIRAARLDDLDGLVELEELCFEHDCFHRRQLRYLITKAQGQVLIYEMAGQVCGALILSWRRNSPVGRITSVAVRPEYHGQGIGTVLVRQAENIAQSRGLKKMHLEVRQDNQKAINFYEGHGYTRVGLKADYYWDGMTGISYRKLF